MKITFLGTGTSQGVPVIGCTCEVCASTDSRDKRLRSSILIQFNGNNYVVDTGPDFREQMLRTHISSLQAIIYTHPHRDHVAGLDDVRAFNFIMDKPIDIYATEAVQTELKREFYYAFESSKYPGLPQVILNTITNQPFTVNDLEFTPIQVYHHLMPVFGYRVHNFVYITDANRIEDAEIAKIEGCDTLVINALRLKPHLSHFTLNEALGVIERVKPRRAFLTHISHQLGLHNDVSRSLPHHVKLAFDGLELDVA